MSSWPIYAQHQKYHVSHDMHESHCATHNTAIGNGRHADLYLSRPMAYLADIYARVGGSQASAQMNTESVPDWIQ